MLGLVAFQAKFAQDQQRLDRVEQRPERRRGHYEPPAPRGRPARVARPRSSPASAKGWCVPDKVTYVTPIGGRRARRWRRPPPRPIGVQRRRRHRRRQHPTGAGEADHGRHAVTTSRPAAVGPPARRGAAPAAAVAPPPPPGRRFPLSQAAARAAAWSPCSSSRAPHASCSSLGSRRPAADRRGPRPTGRAARASAPHDQLTAARGAIFDRNGYELALSVPQTHDLGRPRGRRRPGGTAAQPGAIASASTPAQTAARSQQRLGAADKEFVYVARQVDDATAKGSRPQAEGRLHVQRAEALLPVRRPGQGRARRHRPRRQGHRRPRAAVRRPLTGEPAS